MTWFTLSLLSITALAAAELTQQYLLNKDNKINERTSAVLTFFVQSLFTIPLLFFFTDKESVFKVFTPAVLPQILAVTAIASIAIIFYFKSLTVRNISISTIFISFSVVVSTTLGIVFLGEGAYPVKLLGIALVLLAIISLNIKNFALEKNHFYGLAAGVFFGITYTLDKAIVTNIEPINYIFWAFFLVAVLIFIFDSGSVVNSLKATRLTDYKPVVFSGIGYFIYNFATFTAYTRGGEVGRVDAINNSQVFLIILFEYFVLKHKGSLARKLATAAMAFIGILILGYW